MTMSSSGISLVRLEQDVYLRRPSKAHGVGNREPTVVIILGWMDAQLRHLQKYSDIYTDVFPESTQLLVRCPRSHFYSLPSSKTAKYRTVVEVLKDLGFFSTNQPSPNAPTILFHVFSNGGCIQYLCIADATNRLIFNKPGNAPLSWTTGGAIVFDGCPGGMDISSAIRAFTAPPYIRKSWILYLITAILVLTGCALFRLGQLLGLLPSFEWLRECHLDAYLLPRPFHGHTGAGIPRLYMYSKMDELMPWKDVFATVREGRARGLDVREEIFERSGHVVLARDEPERYWGAVKDLWAHGLSQASGIIGASA